MRADPGYHRHTTLMPTSNGSLVLADIPAAKRRDVFEGIVHETRKGKVRLNLSLDLWQEIWELWESSPKSTPTTFASKEVRTELDRQISRAGNDPRAVKRVSTLGLGAMPPGTGTDLERVDRAKVRLVAAMKDKDPIRAIQVILDTCREADERLVGEETMPPPSADDLRWFDELGCGVRPVDLVCWYARPDEAQTDTEKRIRVDRVFASRNPQTGRAERFDADKVEAARLTRDGESTWKIGARVGVSHNTVARWLRGDKH